MTLLLQHGYVLCVWGREVPLCCSSIIAARACLRVTFDPWLWGGQLPAAVLIAHQMLSSRVLCAKVPERGHTHKNTGEARVARSCKGWRAALSVCAQHWWVARQTLAGPHLQRASIVCSSGLLSISGCVAHGVLCMPPCACMLVCACAHVCCAARADFVGLACSNPAFIMWPWVACSWLARRRWGGTRALRGTVCATCQRMAVYPDGWAARLSAVVGTVSLFFHVAVCMLHAGLLAVAS